MFMLVSRKLVWVLVLCLVVPASEPLLAVDSPDLHRAYYLEKAAHDYTGARAIYEKLAAGSRGDESLLREARSGAARCRDHLAAADFAALMPPDALGYVQIRRPGELIGSLAGMLGLTTSDMGAMLAARPSADSAIPFHLPKEIALSPALLESFGRFGGAGFAAMGIGHDGPPPGVLVLHFGDVTLLKGLFETAFQFAPTARKVADLPTFTAPPGFVGVMTESLLILGTDRSLVEGVVARLEGREKSSLASHPDLEAIATQRRSATLFAFADVQQVIKHARAKMADDAHAMREFAQAEILFDLKNLRSAYFSFGIHQRTLSLELAVRMAEGHNNLIYNLIRTPPMSRRSLAFVPADAAAIFGLGLNPATAPRSASASGDATPSGISALDIAREIFGNIEEISVFVIPGDGGGLLSAARGDRRKHGMPDVGFVVATADPKKSAALWGQLLALPAMFGGRAPSSPKALEIAGVSATEYEMPDVGPVFTSQLDGCLLVGLSKHAMKSAIQARKREQSVLTDEIMAAALKLVPPDASLMCVVHAGRCASVAAGLAPMAERVPLNLAAGAMKETLLWAAVGESPSQFSLRVGLRGLPNVNELVQKFAPLIPQPRMDSGESHHRRPRRVEPDRPQRPADRPGDESNQDEDDDAENDA